MVGWGCVFFFNGVGAFYWLVEEDDVGFPHAIGRQAEHVDAAVVGHVPLELIVGPSLGWNMFQVVFFLALDHGKSFKTLLWSRSSKNKNTIGINPVPICLFVFFFGFNGYLMNWVNGRGGVSDQSQPNVGLHHLVLLVLKWSKMSENERNWAAARMKKKEKKRKESAHKEQRNPKRWQVPPIRVSGVELPDNKSMALSLFRWIWQGEAIGHSAIPLRWLRGSTASSLLVATVFFPNFLLAPLIFGSGAGLRRLQRQ